MTVSSLRLSLTRRWPGVVLVAAGLPACGGSESAVERYAEVPLAELSPDEARAVCREWVRESVFDDARVLAMSCTYSGLLSGNQTQCAATREDCIARDGAPSALAVLRSDDLGIAPPACGRTPHPAFSSSCTVTVAALDLCVDDALVSARHLVDRLDCDIAGDADSVMLEQRLVMRLGPRREGLESCQDVMARCPGAFAIE